MAPQQAKWLASRPVSAFPSNAGDLRHHSQQYNTPTDSVHQTGDALHSYVTSIETTFRCRRHGALRCRRTSFKQFKDRFHIAPLSFDTGISSGPPLSLEGSVIKGGYCYGRSDSHFPRAVFPLEAFDWRFPT